MDDQTTKNQPGLSGLDRIRLTGVAGFGHHGVFEHERRSGQPFVVDVELYADLGRAAASDDLADTVDYGGLAAAILADIEGEPVNLIESLARRIGDTCLRAGAVQQVAVTVHKPEAPMPVAVADVAVTLTTTRREPAASEPGPVTPRPTAPPVQIKERT